MSTLPRWVGGLAAVAVGVLLLPLIGLVSQVPFGRVTDVVTSDVVVDALTLSILCSLLATALAVALGVPLALWLSHSRAPGRDLVRSLTTVSLVLPPVVAGLALLATLGRNSAIGGALDDAFGVTIPFSTAAVIIAQTFVALPFVVLTVEAALSSTAPALEHAARSLGATPTETLRRVTIPTVSAAVQAGTVLAFARALGEFGATITFAGSFPGRTQTLPLAAAAALETDPDAAMTVGLILVAVSIATLFLLRRQWWGPLQGKK